MKHQEVPQRQIFPVCSTGRNEKAVGPVLVVAWLGSSALPRVEFVVLFRFQNSTKLSQLSQKVYNISTAEMVLGSHLFQFTIQAGAFDLQNS